MAASPVTRSRAAARYTVGEGIAFERARHDIAVAAVVARAANDGDLDAGPLPDPRQDDRRDRTSGGLHEHRARHAHLLDGRAVDRLHLGAGHERLHHASRTTMAMA